MNYPFSAVVGQEQVKKALIYNVINPQIGGVLICGEKGTAKSTLVRGLSDIMDKMDVVELPLNVTEDRLIGSMNIELAVKQGERSFEPGILKNAHGNFLYVDEVNLLSHHIVFCLMEVSASGYNKVEREGISFTHESSFSLVGTMNPEEGELGSGMLDRFGLYVQVHGSKQEEERLEIIKRRIAFEEDPSKFHAEWMDESFSIANRIKKAKGNIKSITVSQANMKLAAKISEENQCQGHRAELVIIETAKAITAYDIRKTIMPKDIYEAASLAIPHRMNQGTSKSMVEENQENQENQEEQMENEDQNQNDQFDSSDHENNIKENQQDQDNDIDQDHIEEGTQGDQNPHKTDSGPEEVEENVDEIGDMLNIQPMDIRAKDRKKRSGKGKRSKTKTDDRKGRYIKYTRPKGPIKDIAIDATVRAAAPYQTRREKGDLAFAIHTSDFRDKVREKRTGTSILFVVDGSGSMGAKKRMSAVKGAILSLLMDAYQKRDEVGMVVFKGSKAQVVLPFTRSVDLANKCLSILPTGGRTPLADGLCLGLQTLQHEMLKNEETLPFLVLITDGRANCSNREVKPFDEAIKMAEHIGFTKIQSMVIDSEQDFIKLGLAKDIAEAMGADYLKLEDIESNSIVDALKSGL